MIGAEIGAETFDFEAKNRLTLKFSHKFALAREVHSLKSPVIFVWRQIS